MPISLKEFQEGNFTIVRGRAFEVLEFLKRNKDKAYTSKEIAEAVKSNQVSVTPILKRLTKEGLIDRKLPYYMLSKEDKKTVVEESRSKPKSKSNKKEVVEEEMSEEEFEPYEGEEGEPEPYEDEELPALQ